MRRFVFPLLIALQFLTRFPVSVRRSPTPQELGHSVVAYPLVGLFIGISLLGLHILLAQVPALLQAALLVTLWVVISGALHLDGLADSSDAWLGGQGNRTRSLAIMKDPTSGPAAVVAVALLLMLKFAALATLINHVAWPALLISPLLGRSAVVFLLLTTPYVRVDGIGRHLSAQLPKKAAWIILIVTLLVIMTGTVVTQGMTLLEVLGVLIIVFIGVYWLRRLMLKRLGGTTGDTAGALIEIIETLVLIGASLLLSLGFG